MLYGICMAPSSRISSFVLWVSLFLSKMDKRTTSIMWRAIMCWEITIKLRELWTHTPGLLVSLRANVHHSCLISLPAALYDIITTGDSPRIPCTLIWFDQPQCPFKKLKGRVVLPVPSGPSWISIPCCTRCNSLFWQAPSGGFIHTDHRWKGQAAVLHLLLWTTAAPLARKPKSGQTTSQWSGPSWLFLLSACDSIL